MTTVGPLSRAQQSSLFISTRVTWAGMMARACSINWAGTPIKTGVACPMASATLAKVACAKRPATRQLSGRNGQIIQTACWCAHSAGMVKPSAAGVVFMVLMLIARLLAWIETPLA